MTLSGIRSTLAELGMRPSRSLGQNFLHDQNLAHWIVDQLELAPEDHLVEIGPGLGALTESALPRCRSATLIEKDRRLAEVLAKRFAGGGAANAAIDDAGADASASATSAAKVEVLHRDALEFDVRELFPRAPVKLLGNLPYYVTSPVLFRFTAEPTPVERLVLTIQREFAERLAAGPGTKEYGALTVIIGRGWQVKYLRTLPGSVFYPEPNVESAVIVLTPRAPDELPECDGDLFVALVKQGFSQRRKQLGKLLREHLPDWPGLAAALGVPVTVRGEELGLEQWIALTNSVRPCTGTAQEVHKEFFDVVDENNCVIGRETRHEVHTRRLLHRAVHVFVFNQAGELFLQRRSRWKDLHPRRWDSSAAGHLNAGEDYDKTAAREIEEELGISAPVEFVMKIPASRSTGWEFVQLYRVQHDGPFALCRAEVEGGGFFPVPLVERWIAARPKDFANGFRECFARFLETRTAR